MTTIPEPLTMASVLAYGCPRCESACIEVIEMPAVERSLVLGWNEDGTIAARDHIDVTELETPVVVQFECDDCGCAFDRPRRLGATMSAHAALVARISREMMREILRDIRAGTVPADVASYAALHDDVDANEYAAGGRPPVPEDDEDRTAWHAYEDAWAVATDIVNDWLVAGRPDPERVEWSGHLSTLPCQSCGKRFKISREAWDMSVADDPSVSDVEREGYFDLCLGCVADAMYPYPDETDV